MCLDGAIGARISLDVNRATAANAPQQLDMAGLMRIMQPPRRTVAVSEDHLVVGVLGGAAGTNGVRVTTRNPATGGLARAGGGGCTKELGAAESYGASVAVSGDFVSQSDPPGAGVRVGFRFSEGHLTAVGRKTSRLTGDSIQRCRFWIVVVVYRRCPFCWCTRHP